MNIDSLITEIRDALSDISGHLENIDHGISRTPELMFTTRVAHVLMCDNLYDQEKLNCIRILYLQMAWPEKEITEEKKDLLGKIK